MSINSVPANIDTLKAARSVRAGLLLSRTFEISIKNLGKR